jgi:SAM-dependent MidA family methyltransferase
MIETISNTSSLAARLRKRIRREGPLKFSDWMKAALYDPEDGYYCRADRKKWGRQGDYRTSPERSSLFAATFARYFAGLFDELGRPSRWTVVEVGAGDGHFAKGVLQTLQQFFPQVFESTSYVIDEISPHSRMIAQKRLESFLDRVEFRKLDEIDINPGVVFSNELLDALAVDRVTLQGDEFKQLYITVGEAGNFEWLLDAVSPTLAPHLESHFEICGLRPAEGQIVEITVQLEEWLRGVAARLRKGFLVTVDYGADAADLYARSVGTSGTLRGFQRHQFVDDLLATPGEHDLTTTVNWSLVKSVGASVGFECSKFDRQDRFLLAAGFLEQLELQTSRTTSEAERLRLRTAAREMIMPDGMAAHFQVLVQKKLVSNLGVR